MYVVDPKTIACFRSATVASAARDLLREMSTSDHIYIEKAARSSGTVSAEFYVLNRAEGLVSRREFFDACEDASLL